MNVLHTEPPIRYPFRRRDGKIVYVTTAPRPVQS